MAVAISIHAVSAGLMAGMGTHYSIYWGQSLITGATRLRAADQRHCASLTNCGLGNLLRTNCGLGDKVVRTSDCALFVTRSPQGGVPIRSESELGFPIRS